MDHPVQKDGIICGVATVNALERFLVESTTIMTPETQNQFRLQYAIRLVDLHRRRVCYSPVRLPVSNQITGVSQKSAAPHNIWN